MKRHKMKQFLLLLRSRGIELLACVAHNGDSLTAISGTHAYTVLLQDWVWPEISREKKWEMRDLPLKELPMQADQGPDDTSESPSQ